jgi:hypothetical protein
MNSFLALTAENLVDPIKLLVFGALGAIGIGRPRSRIGPLTACVLVALSAVYLLPILYDQFKFESGSFSPVDGYSAWDDIKDDPRYLPFATSFAGFRSPAETRLMKAKIDRDDGDCRIIAGSWPEFSLRVRCQSAKRWSIFVSGTIQFALGAVVISLWRRKRHAPAGR